jgi:hypothetical protein
MLRKVSSVIGIGLEATDGDIGTIVDMYFDDVSWAVRFIVLKTSEWLSWCDLLIPAGAVSRHGGKRGSLAVTGSKDQMRHNPGVHAGLPVYRRQENGRFEYHPWRDYWEGIFSVNKVWGSVVPALGMGGQVEEEVSESGKPAQADLHLGSAREMIGYSIHATDGSIGHVRDFIFDDQTLNMAYLEVGIPNWFGGRRVFVAVRRVREVLWESAEVVVDVGVSEVKGWRQTAV